MNNKTAASQEKMIPDFEYVLHSALLMIGKWFHSLLTWYENLFTLSSTDQFKVYANLVNHYRKKGKLDEAVAMAKKALKTAGAQDKAAAQRNLADLFFAISDFTNAKTNYEICLKKNSADSKIKVRLAIICRKNGDIEGAIKFFEEALELNAKDHETMYNVAQLYDKANKREEAVAMIQKALALSPNCISYHQFLGFLYESLDKHQDALPHFKKVMELEHAAVANVVQ
ncbi:MAG: tetratricopeptide repeat protein [Bacteriovoracaceae bacterium]|nr:tetratricopeptide repeat protein [Bacteriovoracaceae bacterium]